MFIQNICERNINSESFESTTKNGLTNGKQCSKGLIASEYITSRPCMPYFGKWIDVGETAMPHFNFAHEANPATATEEIFCENLIDKSSRQCMNSIVLQHNEQSSLTRTSSDDNCEKLHANFVTFTTDDAYCKAAESFESPVAKTNAEGFSELSKEEKLTAPAKFGENFLNSIWKECATDETDKKENENSNVFATVRGSSDAIQEGGTVFGTLRQHLALATFKKPENQG